MNAARLFGILITAFLLVLPTGRQAQAEWQQVGTAGFTAGEAYYTRLAFDSSGRPYS